MKKIITLTALTLGLVAHSAANAEARNTVSLGYAQTNAKHDDETMKPKGANLKYRYEFDSQLGVVTSLTYTSKKISENDKTTKLTYGSLMVGPSFRFNEYVSAYATIGAARGKHEITGSTSDTASKNAMAYGAGLQFNPMENVAIDASYEYSKINDMKAGTWVLGVGYYF